MKLEEDPITYELERDYPPDIEPEFPEKPEIFPTEYRFEGRIYECEVAVSVSDRFVEWVDVWLDDHRVLITADMREAIVMQVMREYF